MDMIKEYFIQNKGVTPVVAAVLSKPLEKYEDIKTEFCQWIESGTYKKGNPLNINGYTAEHVHEIAPQLDGAGVYNFLVTLRDSPDKAQEYIKNGFPTK